MPDVEVSAAVFASVARVCVPHYPDAAGPARLARWLAEDGASVEAGQNLAELEMDKVVFTLASPMAGTLAIHAREGDKLVPGAVAATVTPRDRATATPAAAVQATATAGQAPDFALPPAGPLCLDEGYDPREIDAAAGPPEPLPPVRAVTARRMAASLRQAPCFALESVVDMSAAVALRARMRAEPSLGKATYNDMILWASAQALARHRHIADVWTPAGRVRRDGVHIGFAMALEPEGLIVPVLRDADRMGLAELSRRTLELARRARKRELTPADYAGGVFSVTNLGIYPIDAFTAVVNPGETAILAAGRVADGPWVEDGELMVRPQLRLTLTADHRIVDGAEGARFLAAIKVFLERMDETAINTVEG